MFKPFHWALWFALLHLEKNNNKACLGLVSLYEQARTQGQKDEGHVQRQTLELCIYKPSIARSHQKLGETRILPWPLW